MTNTEGCSTCASVLNAMLLSCVGVLLPVWVFVRGDGLHSWEIALLNASHVCEREHVCLLTVKERKGKGEGEEDCCSVWLREGRRLNLSLFFCLSFFLFASPYLFSLFKGLSLFFLLLLNSVWPWQLMLLQWEIRPGWEVKQMHHQANSCFLWAVQHISKSVLTFLPLLQE